MNNIDLKMCILRIGKIKRSRFSACLTFHNLFQESERKVNLKLLKKLKIIHALFKLIYLYILKNNYLSNNFPCNIKIFMRSCKCLIVLTL